MIKTHLARSVLLALLASACSSSSDSGEQLATPVPDPAAAARAFKLYYKERVERAMLAYNRFMLVGDTTFGTTLGKSGIARQGNTYEVVIGPNDNNMIGISVWTTWHAYKIFGTRQLELSLVRMLNGLSFFEAVSGHPGMTARMVWPGWTREVDGEAGTVTRTRDGVTAVPGDAYSPELEAEMLEAFWDGIQVTYREDPADFLFNYMPAVETGPYAVTYGFSALPRYLRSSDCCASIMRTPADYPWEGAYWGNHNSRDNFPDLALGIVTAMDAANDETAPPEVREAARRVVQAGQRIGDLIAANDAIMTVDEHNPYDFLINSGAVRPDGETEIEDLGKLADCQMAFLSRALSSTGLSLPLPEVKAPSSIEYILVAAIGEGVDCEVPQEDRVCRRLEEAFCGQDWATIEQMEIYGNPWLDLVRAMGYGGAEAVIGGFQDDFYEITLAATALVNYADAQGDAELGAQARGVLGDLSAVMRVFAEIIYPPEDGRLAERMYQAALFDAWGGLDSTPVQDLGALEVAERHMASIESWLEIGDTQPAPMKTDEAIRAEVEGHLSGRSESVKTRFSDEYGDTIPVRVNGETYEARGFPEADWPWRTVERPHHRIVGGARLLHALPLCHTAPQILDCTWAAHGCARADLDGSGTVDTADTSAFESARSTHQGGACRSNNQWCDGADLDHTGTIDETDAAFLQAAAGCRI